MYEGITLLMLLMLLLRGKCGQKYVSFCTEVT